jgi:ATP-dependent DNA ligase
MLAQANKFMDRIVFPAFAQTKMDGLRANIIIENGKTTVFSRNGKEITTFGHFDDMTRLDNIMLDGELLVHPPKGFELVHKERTLKYDGDTPMDRQTGNGIVNKSIVSDKRRVTITKEEVSMFKIILWDMVELKGWKTGHDPEPYDERFNKLQTINDDDRFGLVESQTVNDLNSAMKLFKKKLKEGQEGLILKNRDMPWENKRSYHMVKMKDVKEIDLLCTEWIPGSGKNEGILGALKCQNKDGTIEVNVGSGFNDEHRNSLKPKDVVGKIIAVKYNDLIKSRDNKPTSLFLPIFVEVRSDKTEAD